MTISGMLTSTEDPGRIVRKPRWPSSLRLSDAAAIMASLRFTTVPAASSTRIERSPGVASRHMTRSIASWPRLWTRAW